MNNNYVPFGDLKGARLILAAFVLALANFMVVLDMTIANVSVPHITGSLAVSSSQGTWVITSYAVAEAICVPLTGWLAANWALFSALQVATPAAMAIARITAGPATPAAMPMSTR